MRKVAARAFTRPRLMALEPTIEALANDIVERAVERSEVEWIGEVAQPIGNAGDGSHARDCRGRGDTLASMVCRPRSAARDDRDALRAKERAHHG